MTDTYYYNPTEDVWTPYIALNDARFRMASSSSEDLGIYAIGGMEPAWTGHTTNEQLDKCPNADDDSTDDDSVDDDSVDDDSVDDDSDDDDSTDDDADDDADDDSGDDDSGSHHKGCCGS